MRRRAEQERAEDDGQVRRGHLIDSRLDADALEMVEQKRQRVLHRRHSKQEAQLSPTDRAMRRVS